MIRLAIFLVIVWDAAKVYLGLHAPILQVAFLGPALLLGSIAGFRGSASNVLVRMPLGIWFVWIAYALISTFLIVGFDPHRDTSVLVFSSSILLGPIFAGLLASSRVGTSQVLDTVLFALAFRMLLSVAFDDLGQLGNDDFARFGVEFNANAIASGGFFATVVLTIRRRMFGPRWFDIPLSAMALFMLLLTASVKFFVAWTLFFAGVIAYDVIQKSRPGKIRKSVVVAFSALILAIVVIPQTSVVGRTLDKFERSMNAKESTQLFDNRAAQYILGWEAFKESPVNGIGLRGFMGRSGNTAPLHSEYLVQLVEAGIIGATLFLAFWLSLGTRLARAWKTAKFRAITLLHILSLGILLYLYLGIWSYNIPINWLLIGLALRHTMVVRADEAKSVL